MASANLLRIAILAPILAIALGLYFLTWTTNGAFWTGLVTAAVFLGVAILMTLVAAPMLRLLGRAEDRAKNR